MTNNYFSLSLSHLNCWTTLLSKVESVSAKRDPTNPAKKVRKSFGGLVGVNVLNERNENVQTSDIFVSPIFSLSKNRKVKRQILQNSRSHPE